MKNIIYIFISFITLTMCSVSLAALQVESLEFNQIAMQAFKLQPFTAGVLGAFLLIAVIAQRRLSIRQAS